jgi:hypothetical protein
MFIMVFHQSPIIRSIETLLYMSERGNLGTRVEVSMGKGHMVKIGERPCSEAINPCCSQLRMLILYTNKTVSVDVHYILNLTKDDILFGDTKRFS